MRKYLLLAVAVIVALGGIWFASTDPHAERLRTDVKMDINGMTLKAKDLPTTVVDNFM